MKKTKRKRFLGLLLAFALIFTDIPVTALAETGISDESESAAEAEVFVQEQEEVEMMADSGSTSGTCGTGLSWQLDNEGTLTISGNGAMTDYSSGSKAPWYNNRTDIKKVSVEDGVTGIGNYAFYCCNSMTDIVLPDSLTRIGQYAFYECSKLEEIRIPDQVTGIETYTFYDCVSMTSVILPDTLTSIGYAAFCYCIGLTGITLPQSLTVIGDYAFEDCSALATITIPQAVTNLGYSAFYGCVNLNAVYISDLSSWCGIIFDEYTSNPLYLAHKLYLNGVLLTELIIPDEVTDISSYAFYGCNISGVTLPDSLVHIGKSAFGDCENLEMVRISDVDNWYGVSFDNSSANPLYYGHNLYVNGVLLTSLEVPADITEIKPYTFCGCGSLSGIILPDSLENIGEYAFYNCSSLTGIVIPDKITEIGDYTFSGCSSLTNVSLPDSLVNIGTDAFYKCSKLTGITIPDEVTSIGNYAFYGCEGLKEVHVSDLNIWFGITFGTCSNPLKYARGFYVNEELKTTVVIPEKVTSIGNEVFSGYSSLTEIVFHEHITDIGDYAFNSCTGLTELTMSDNISEIGKCAFSNCENLTEISLPDHLTVIHDYAFSQCNRLAEIVFPSEPTEIGLEAFRGCINLKRITFSGDAPEFGSHVFDNVTATAYYPQNNRTWTESVLQDYGGTIMWEGYMPSEADNNCGANLYWELEQDGTLYISGTGNMYEYSKNQFPWDQYAEKILLLVIGDGVTGISDYAFAGCSKLSEIVFSGNAPQIASHAFENVTAVAHYPSGDETWMEEVRQNYGGTITWETDYHDSGICGENVTWTLDVAGTLRISGSGNMESYDSEAEVPWHDRQLEIIRVIIEENVSSIAEYAFSGCSNLEEITMPQSLTSISWYAFYNCSSLKRVDLPDNISFIGSDVFTGCSSLTGVWVSENNQSFSCDDSGVLFDKGKTELIHMPDGFQGTYTVPDSVAKIGRTACNDCVGLTGIKLPENLTDIGNYAFDGCCNLCDVIIPDKVSSIGSRAFYECSGFADIIIPDAVIDIGMEAFAYCSNLVSIKLPEKMTSISGGTFQGCGKLKSITVPESVRYIYNKAFYECTSMENIVLPDTLLELGDNVFYYCTNLRQITLPYGFSYIGWGTFWACRSLTEIVIPGSVTSIDGCAFFNCENLEHITIPESVTSIGARAFMSCYSLDHVKIPDKVTTIKTLTFANCYSLKNITLPGSILTFGSGVFENCNSLKNTVLPAAFEIDGGHTFYGCSDLESVIFCGSAPSLSDKIFDSLKLITVYYPAGDTTWTDDVFENLGGKTVQQSYVPTGEITVILQPEDYVGTVGDTAVFTVVAAGDGITYQWQYCNAGSVNWKNSGQSGNQTNELSIPVTNSRNGQKYRCMITNGAEHQIVTAEAVISVPSAGTELKITRQPEDYTGKIGEMAVFTVTAAGNSLSYQWEYRNVNSSSWKASGQSGNKTDTLSVPITETRDGQKYRCVITDADRNSVTSDAVVLHVKEAQQELIINRQPEDYIGEVGVTAAFAITAAGNSLSYQWEYQNAGSSVWKASGQSGNKTDTLSVPVTEARDGQKYRCVITDGAGNQVISDTATLHVGKDSDTVAITGQPEDYTGAVGETAVFNVTASGEGLSYQWEYQNYKSTVWKASGQSGNKTDTLQVPITAARDGQKYRCVVMDIYGNTVTSDAAALYLTD